VTLCDGPGLVDTGGEPKTQAEGIPISANEKKRCRNFEQEFNKVPLMLVVHEESA